MNERAETRISKKDLEASNGGGRRRMSNRTFGFAVGMLSFVVGVFGWLFFDQRLYWLFTAGGIFWLVAALAPWLLLPVNLLWHRLTRSISAMTNLLILGSIFYLIFVPAGMALRLFGHNPVAGKVKQSVDSYFSPVQRQSDAKTMLDWF